MRQDQEVLVRNNFVSIPRENAKTPVSMMELTILMGNVTHYGYSLSEEAFKALGQCSHDLAVAWWQTVEPALKKLTGADKPMGEFVVYKNFPGEVLSMDESEYWFRQILMYWGFPNEYFTQPEAKRESMDEKVTLRVLHLADNDTLKNIYRSLLKLPSRWTDGQWADVKYLAERYYNSVSLSDVSFKENMVQLASLLLESGLDASVSTGTDVLRLAVGLSGGDVSLREKAKLINFPRKTRKFLLSCLDGCNNLEEDIRRDPGRWKRLLRALRPGDYAKQCPNVVAAYDKLYNNKLPQSFNGQVEAKLAANDSSVLVLLKSRPGEFLRRLYVCVSKFDMDAATAFVEVLPRLKTVQLLKIQGFLNTVNKRKHRLFPPNGNWNRVKLSPMEGSLPQETVHFILENLWGEIRNRVGEKVPAVQLDERTKFVKLQTNDSELSPYGRGTVFPMPDNVTFIRSASYWQAKGYGNVWYDNGWNFFDRNWKDLGAICWNAAKFQKNAAAFSGDPTNSKDSKGRACQVIDLYLDKLAAHGVRYAVWSVLCYSKQCFDEADEVFASLQWGEKADKGKIFEPSRSQLAFPIKGKNFTKFVAYIDIKERKLVYLDANLKGDVSSAGANGGKLSEMMPAMVEYLNTLPSVYDLFRNQKQDENGMPVLYTDSDTELEGQAAYVFRPENKDNKFEKFDVNQLL